MYKIELSVHEIVDFLLRKGDIDTRYFNSLTIEEGIRLHKEYQDKQDTKYLKEVKLETNIIYDFFDYHIIGRADGIILNDEEVIIDEIKTTNENLEVFYELNKGWHLGQAEFYAYMYAKDKDLNFISVSLTYISQIDNKQIKKYFRYSFIELENIIYDYLKKYSSFRAILIRKDNMMKDSLKSLSFPYPVLREGQEKLIEITKEVTKNNDVIFIEASTGIGKTVATLFGAFSSLKEGRIDRIFYLTAKNSGFINTIDTLMEFKKTGLRVTSTQITSKDKICINNNKKGKCNSEECPYTKGYYSKLQDVLKELIVNENIFETENIIKIAKEKYMCPFELSLDLSLYSDVIILDYNYAFNPISRLKRYFENPDKVYKKLLLIDEAHNLIDRSRDMYSSSLEFKTFANAKNELKNFNDKKINKTLKEVNKFFKLFKEFEYTKYLKLETLDKDFINSLNALSSAIKEYRNNFYVDSKEIDNFSLELYQFIEIFSYFVKYQERYSLYLERKDNSNFSINIRCLDASLFIKEDTYKNNGTVFFSATLSPITYYKKLILGNEDYSDCLIPSPFNPNNLKILVNDSISLLYKDRMATINEVLIEIGEFTNKKIGNYIVYAPSFEYLDLIKQKINFHNKHLFFQEKMMTKIEKDDFVNSFEINPNKTLVAFCVLGGSFSEGIDFKNNRLNGVVVIGIGLPTISYETNINKEYFDSQKLNGFEYAFVNPGINKIMQAVGRIIRNENDKGAVLLLDRRYKNSIYKPLFNTIWKNNVRVRDYIDISKELDSFYN